MLIRILGSAAGGGFPQWNCNCPNCSGVRAGTIRAQSRLQSSIAVRSVDRNAWTLVNASPDVLQQLRANSDLQPARKLRDSALCSIVLMDGQIDHVAGLLMLREASHPWRVYCTDAVHAELTDELPLLSVLSHYSDWQHERIEPQMPFKVHGLGGVEWLAHELQSKAPPYSRHRVTPASGSNSALVLRDEASKRTALYAPGIGEVSAHIWEHMKQASLVLVDGTCWADDELPRLGVSNRLARDMGHLPLHGAGGMIEWLDRLPSSTRKVLVHINNTNPILDEDSRERAELAEHGIEVASDGLEFEL